MSRGFNYSKWDNIDLSDDESDLHPNIDKESWFRLKHRTRVEREEREEQEKKNLTEANRLADIRIAEINANLQLLADGKEEEVDEDPDAMQAEKGQLLDLNRERTKRLEDLEKNKKWNWENMCQTVEEATTISASAVVGESSAAPAKRILKQTRDGPAAVNQAAETKPTSTSKAAAAKTTTTTPASASNGASPPPAAPASKAAGAPAPGNSSSSAKPVTGPRTETAEVESYASFVEAHEALLDRFIDTNSMDVSRELIREHPQTLLAEHAASFLLLSCLEDEMNGNHARMRLCARQSQLLSHIAELAKSMGRHPRDLLDAFFVRMGEGPHYMEFMNQVHGFIERIQRRAVEKRKEMTETEEVPLEKIPLEERLGPGGLDPMEVFESLPAELQAAFESRDTEQLKTVLGGMPPDVASDTLQRCIDSGLWVV